MKRLALIITGDRTATDDPETEQRWAALMVQHVSMIVQRYDWIVVIHGACGESVGKSTPMKGIDAIAHRTWNEVRCCAVVPMPADWTAHGGKAGPVRNRAMLDVQQSLSLQGYTRLTIAYHDGDIGAKGSGTGDCVRQSRVRGVRTRHLRSDGSEVAS